jgi:hypothetical protein
MQRPRSLGGTTGASAVVQSKLHHGSRAIIPHSSANRTRCQANHSTSAHTFGSVRFIASVGFLSAPSR